MTIRDQISEEAYGRLLRFMCAAFPDSKLDDRDAQIEALVHEMWSHWDPCMGRDLGLPPPPTDMPKAAVQPLVMASADPATYYVAEATHRRGTAAPQSAFVGYLPVVRVRAPQSGVATIHTGGGDVYSGDHLVYSVDDVNAKFANALGYHATRVDIVTPPRLWGARFAAVAAFIGYRDESGPPSFYLLEAGMATGEPKVLFFAKTMDTEIVDWSSYTPTPFSAANHRYAGKLAVSASGEPVALSVKAFRKPKNGNAFEPNPYISIDAVYEKATGPSELFPAAITAQAALRVASIAEALNMDVFHPFTSLMADLGDVLPWLSKPVKT